jgi:lysophospholipase L1-like esterase
VRSFILGESETRRQRRVFCCIAAGKLRLLPHDYGWRLSQRPRENASAAVSVAMIDSYNAILPEPAKEARPTFIPLVAMPEHYTIDGVHLNAAGYEVWDKAILQGIESVLCKST